MPPTLAPLNAIESAAGRFAANQGDTIALIAAAPSDTQPAPLNIVARKSCQGSRAAAQPTTPTERIAAPPIVVAGRPNALCSRGRFATMIAPVRKCSVTAVETRVTDQPRASCTAFR